MVEIHIVLTYGRKHFIGKMNKNKQIYAGQTLYDKHHHVTLKDEANDKAMLQVEIKDLLYISFKSQASKAKMLLISLLLWHACS